MEIEKLRPILLRQYGGALEMFESHIRACPDILWTAPMWKDPAMPPGFSEFWYVVSHTLFWLDLYLEGHYEGFQPPAPFTLVELDPAGALPDRVYAKEELLNYLDYCRNKIREIIGGLTDERAQETCQLHWGELPFLELLIDNLRHVQEHSAQLGMFLGQFGINNNWISQTVYDEN